MFIVNMNIHVWVIISWKENPISAILYTLDAPESQSFSYSHRQKNLPTQMMFCKQKSKAINFKRAKKNVTLFTGCTVIGSILIVMCHIFGIVLFYFLSTVFAFHMFAACPYLLNTHPYTLCVKHILNLIFHIFCHH